MRVAPDLPGPWIVAGMHRSGTSLIASALAAAGVDMGERLLAGDEHNRPGYFEDLDVLDLDRRVLAAASTPGDPGHADWGWTESERLDLSAAEAHRGEARALIAARAAAGRPWGFKDPRAALLLDFWLSVAPDARFVLPYRLPWQVADSLQRLGADVFLRHPDYGYRIWTFYNRHILDFHRRHPERTVLVSIDAAIADPSRFAHALSTTLGIDLPEEAFAARLEAELFHSLPASDPLGALVGAAHPSCIELLAALDAEAALPAAGLWQTAAPRSPRKQAAPQVTVVVPCYDDGELLLEAVASVERSIDLPHELIIVDDGSTQPRTLAILDLLAAAGFDVHRVPHGGLAAARNHGFAAARAPFVIPLDADNRLVPEFVQSAIAVLTDDPRIAAVYGDRLEFGRRNGLVEVGPFDIHRLVGGNYIDACAVVRRQAWQECGGYDAAMPLQGWEDWELWLTLIEGGWALHWLRHPGFEYRVRPNSMLHALEASPELGYMRAHVLAKHHELFTRSLNTAVAALRDTRDAAARQRHTLHTHLATWRAWKTDAAARRGSKKRTRAGAAFPCVIGATGGSGTRALARVAAGGGLFIGDDRNEFEDALPIERFLDQWVIPFWQGGGAETPHVAPPGMDEGFAEALEAQLAGVASSVARGWKSPRSLYVMPFLAQRLPDLRFLHLVRDGRDMALSANQLQLARYGEVLLSAAEQQCSEAERSIALWNRVNLWAADLGEHLGDAYLRVRFEDLCARPAAVTRDVFRFFQLPGNPRQAARLVSPPESLGRWRRADGPLVSRLELAGGAALRRFGYLSDS